MLKKRMTAWVTAAAMLAALAAPMTVSHAQTQTYEVGTDKAYKTISAAVAAAKAANPQSENDRITINVAPGDYEEQVIIDGLHYVTLQQAPGTNGKVDLHWYYCTGYCAANCDLDGSYDPDIDWYTYKPTDGSKEYSIGDAIKSGTVLTYRKKSSEAQLTKTVSKDTYLGDTGSAMAPLIVRGGSTDVTVKDFNIVNSVPVMVTQGEKDAHLTPQYDRRWGVAESYQLMTRDGLTICNESTTETAPSSAYYSGGELNREAVHNAVTTGNVTFTAEESAWLVRSSAYNERGHAVSVTDGDRITFDGIRLRGNQDSLFASGYGRLYFHSCDIIGGTDYIYGSATAVFDSCRLGLAGFTDRAYGSPISTPATPQTTRYGYLFYNCTAYNTRTNNGTHNFGGPWGAAGQMTFYNTTLDTNASVGQSAFVLDPRGFCRFGAEQGLSRCYEYGTKNGNGSAADTASRVVNKSIAEGGYGMGTVLDEWQILEFNPRNYFAAANGPWTGDWDPMGFASNLTDADAELSKHSAITVESGTETEVSLPMPTDNSIEFHWESSSANAQVNNETNKLTVVRPAAGEAAISANLTLYAKKIGTDYGDKRDISVTVNPTTDTTNVFSIPVTITQSLAAANSYTVKVTSGGALIKSQDVTVEGLTGTATLTNIPAGSYDVTVTSATNTFTISEPSRTVTGAAGNSVPLSFEAKKLKDADAELGISYSSGSGMQSYDLIALANDSAVGTSDVLTLEYDLKMNKKLSSGDGTSYIDLRYDAPKDTVSTGADTKRFALGRVYDNWNQLDMGDCSGTMSGASDSDHQTLNISGNFTDGGTYHVTAAIDYRNKTVSVSGPQKSKTFSSFPEDAAKGSLYMGIYPAAKASFTVSNVKLAYKALDNSTVEAPEPITVEYAKNRTIYKDLQYKLAGDVSVSATADARTASWTSTAPEEYRYIFGGTTNAPGIDSKYTQMSIPANNVNGTKFTFTPRVTGAYKVYVLSTEYSGRYFTFTTTNGTAIPKASDTSVSYAADSSNKKLAVTEYELGNMYAGMDYDVTLGLQGSATNKIFAIAFASADTEYYDISDDHVFPAAALDMVKDTNNTNPRITSNTATTNSDYEASVYSKIFGEGGSSLGSNKITYLGSASGSGGYVSFTFKADSEFTANIYAMTANNYGLTLTILDSNGATAVSPAMTKDNTSYGSVYGHTSAEFTLPAGTYTAKITGSGDVVAAAAVEKDVLSTSTRNIGAYYGTDSEGKSIEGDKATGFVTTVSGKGVFNTIAWSITSNGTTKGTGDNSINTITLNGGSVDIGLIVSGLHDEAATAEAAVK